MPKYIDTGDISEIKNIDPKKIVVLDCETTGLDKDDDEILQISLIDGNSDVLLDSYVKPIHNDSWSSAQKIHGISPEMVKDSPVFSDIKEQVKNIIRNADLLIGYNLSFDLGFIRAQNISTRRETKKFDVMKEYAPVHGVWLDWKNDYKWAKLEECAKHYGYQFQAHNSLEDAKVTLKCYHSMLVDDSLGGYLDACGLVNHYKNNNQTETIIEPTITPTKKKSKKNWVFVVMGIIGIVLLITGFQNNFFFVLLGMFLIIISYAFWKAFKD